MATSKTSPKTSRRTRKGSDATEKALSKSEIAERFERATKTDKQFDREKAIALAERNGIKLNLSMDNGRIAMNTRNVLRARALAGQRVVW